MWTTPAGHMGIVDTAATGSATAGAGSTNGTESRWFHALFHHRSCTAPWVNHSYPYARVACGGMAYSADGIDWHYGNPRGTAYRPTVEWQHRSDDEAHATASTAAATTTTTTTITTTYFVRRERPHLIFDDRQRMVALTNGVQYSTGKRGNSMDDATYTLLQPIATD